MLIKEKLFYLIMFYYSVYKGHLKGIYSTWKDCHKNIRGFSGAVFQKFENLNDATYFLEFGSQPNMNFIKKTGIVYLICLINDILSSRLATVVWVCGRWGLWPHRHEA